MKTTRFTLPTQALALTLAMLAGFALGGCGEKKAAGGGSGSAGAGGKGGPGGKRNMKFPVEIAAVEARRVEYSVRAVGAVEAFEKLQVTARVAGAIEKVAFSEGDVVKAGQLLVAIEPARYGIAVQSAKATLARAEAAAADAQAGLARREAATKDNPGLLAGEEVETWRTRVRTAGAEVAAAKAMVAQASLNLRDAYVRAPVGGVIETRDVQTGQYAQPGTVLATLVRRDPLLLRFQVPEMDAARLTVGMPTLFRSGQLGPEEADYTAKIKHVAAQANDDSRMVAITAEVDDARRDKLHAGAFAEVRVPIGATERAAIVPQTAVRPSERGFLSFVIEAGVARERVLELGMRTEDGMVEVRSGLQPGEQLVIRGAEALKDGVEVRTGDGKGKPDGKGGPGGQGQGASAPGGKPGPAAATGDGGVK